MDGEFWLLDVCSNSGGLLLKLYSEERREFSEKVLRIPLHGYLVGGDPERVVYELRDSGLVEDAWVEDWLTPPHYRSSTEVVVFRTSELSRLKHVIRVGVSKGLRHVNDFPNPLIEALFNAGLAPMTKVEVRGGDARPLGWDPTHSDPELSVARMYVDGGQYVAEVDGSAERFSSVGDLARYVVSAKYDVCVVDGELYVKLLEEEPAITSSAYLWFVGGAFRTGEYFEWCRLSYTPPSLMGNVTIGKVVTTMEGLEARRRKYLIDRGTRRAEPFRGMTDLLLQDRGGVIYTPKPGLYWGVCQVDFRSLYPNIIVRFNVSGECVDVPGCGEVLSFGWTPHTVCMDREGVVPASIAKLVRLKALYEELSKTTGLEVYEVRKAAVKWVLVASFGYLGYRNSLFGSVMAHEMVTSTSRYLMGVARKVVKSMGYRVIHALVDSLFVEGVTTVGECCRVAETISKITGFDAKVESHYTWLYIPNNFEDVRGAANKYYGKLSSGGMKLKGITCGRSDTPPIIKEAQLRALGELAMAETEAEMVEAVLRAHEALRNYRRKLIRGDIEDHELLLTRNHCGRRHGYVRPPKYALEGGGPPYILYAEAGGLTQYVGQPLKHRANIYYYLRLLERAASELPPPPK